MYTKRLSVTPYDKILIYHVLMRPMTWRWLNIRHTINPRYIINAHGLRVVLIVMRSRWTWERTEFTHTLQDYFTDTGSRYNGNCDTHEKVEYLRNYHSLDGITRLTHWRRETHIYMRQWTSPSLVQIWLVACSATINYLNQCWLIVNWTTRNKSRWNINWNSNIFI